MKISKIFEHEPNRWGLRGDPLLWREMKNLLSDRDMPSTPEELREIIETLYEECVGHPIDHNIKVKIERFGDSGMSGGFVSPEFWSTTGIQLLVSRHEKS